MKKILTICDVPGPGRGSSFEEIALLVKTRVEDMTRRTRRTRRGLRRGLEEG